MLKPRLFCMLLSTLFILPAVVGAQTQPPAMTGGPPAENFIGEGFCFDTTISNPGGDPGYGPYLRLIVPPGMTFDSASVFELDLDGLGLITDVGVFPAAPGNQLVDPLTGTLVTGPEGARFYTLMAPVGSVVFGQPDTVFSICMTIGLPPDAVVGTPLDVTLQPVYLFGDTPTGDNGPIEGTAVTSPVTPTLILFDKSAAGGKNAAGPSDPAGYTLSADVANQQTVTALVFRDTMPASFIYTGHTISGSGVGCSTTTAPAVGANGGLLEVGCTSVLGTTGAGEITISISGYSDDILDHDNCDFQPLPNSATLDASYLGSPLPQASDTAEFVTQHLVIEKSSTESAAPGAPLNYTINFRVSDYIDADNLVLVDTLPDGIDFTVAGPFALTYGGSPYTVTPVVQQDTPGTGQTTVTWDLSGAIGAVLAGGTAGTLTYPATVQTVYDATMIEVLANDALPNTVNGTYDLVGALNPACFDNSRASVTILPVTVSKTIVNPAPSYMPGDTVIFSLTMSIPSGDTADLFFVDFLPLPVFNVTTVNPTWDGPDVYLGPGTTPETAAILGTTPPDRHSQRGGELDSNRLPRPSHRRHPADPRDPTRGRCHRPAILRPTLPDQSLPRRIGQHITAGHHRNPAGLPSGPCARARDHQGCLRHHQRQRDDHPGSAGGPARRPGGRRLERR